VQVVNGPEMLSEFLGESEAAIQGLFVAARALAPTVLFLDEVDAIAPAREGMAARGGGEQTSEVAARVLSTLLTEMENRAEAEKCGFP
jgi:SpoVK/Ycf46/Vps4 family AAA+-type ATPase